MRRVLFVGLVGLVLAACGRKVPYTNLMTSCIIEQNTSAGYIGLEVSHSPRVRLNVKTDDEAQTPAPARSGQDDSGIVVKGYFDIYDDDILVEVQDAQSGRLVQRALCVCVPHLRQWWPCRGASRTWLRE